MRNIRKFILLLLVFIIMLWGKDVFAAEKYTLEDFVFFDPVSTDTCNETNYWTYYNQDTTCYRFAVLSNNDTSSSNTIRLLLDHNLGFTTYGDYRTLLDNETANWTRFNGTIDIPDEDTIADIMKLGSNRPVIDETGQSTSINGGATIPSMYTNTENYVNKGNLNSSYGYWLKGTPSNTNYAYSITQYGNNRLVMKTEKRGVRPVITVNKSLIKRLPITNITSNLRNATEYKYRNQTTLYDGYTYKQLQGFTVTNNNLVFYSSHPENTSKGLLISYKGTNFSTLNDVKYVTEGHGNGLTYIPDENKILVVGVNDYNGISEYDAASYTKIRTVNLDKTYTSVGYDEYDDMIVVNLVRRAVLLNRNYERQYSFDVSHNLVSQDYEYYNGFVYAVGFEAGVQVNHQLYQYNELFSGKVYVIDARLKADGTPDKEFGRLVKVLYFDNIERDGLNGTGEIEAVSFRNGKMWFGFAAHHFDTNYTYKFYEINASDVAPSLSVNTSYKVSDTNTKVTITSPVQLHSLSGWTLSQDKYSLTKTYTDSAVASSINVCDNYSNCTAKSIKELTIKKQSVSFSTLDVSKPFSDGTYTLKATTNGDGTITYSSSDDSIATVDSNGKVTFKKVGSVTISAVASKTDNYYQGSASYSLTITKGNQQISFTKTQVNKTYGDQNFTMAANHTVGNGEVTYSSSNENVATVNNSGVVTIKGTGTTTITATAASTSTYNGASASYSLNVGVSAQELEFDQSSVNKEFGDDKFTIKAKHTKGDGSVTYSSSNVDIASVNNSGVVTIKGVGKVTITATAAATSNYDESSASYSLNISKGKQVIHVDDDDDKVISKKMGDNVFHITALLDVGDGIITYASSNMQVATIDNDGNVTIVGPGETNLSVIVSETDNYESSTKSVLLRVDNVEDEVIKNVPDTKESSSFINIKNIISIFIIILGITYIVRKKFIFEK